MQIIGRTSAFSPAVVSSGFDSVAEGIAQTTSTNGVAALDTAISTFSSADPGASTLFDSQPQVSAAADFPDPASFFKSQGSPGEVLAALGDPGFRPATELNAFSGNLSGIASSLPELQPQAKTLQEMHSTVSRLNGLQQSTDLRLQLAQLGGPAFQRPSVASARKEAAIKDKTEIIQKQMGAARQAAAAEETASKIVRFGGDASTSVGPDSHAVAGADLGKDTYLQLGAGFFEGAKATAEGSMDIGGYGGVTGDVTTYAGVGANADIDVGFKDGDFKFKFGGGVALGLGAGIDLGFDINFKKIGETVLDAGSAAADAVKDAADSVAGFFGDAADSVGDAAGDAADAVGDAAEDVADTIGDAADSVGDAASDAIDTITDW